MEDLTLQNGIQIKMVRHIVLDTNCLLQIISRRGEYYDIWQDFLVGKFVLCVSTEILQEYEEIICQQTSQRVADIIIESILCAPNVKRFDPRYKWNLIESDPDDNKFVDCAIIANAEFIVSDDAHFNILKTIPFPQITIKRLKEFAAIQRKNLV